MAHVVCEKQEPPSLLRLPMFGNLLDKQQQPDNLTEAAHKTTYLRE